MWRWVVKSAICVLLTGLLLGTVFVDSADAGDRRRRSRGRAVVRYETVRYLPARDVVVMRDYYRPYYRPLPPGLAKRYYRTGRMPRGWERRIRPVPVYVERDLHRLPRGYRRGIIDGHVVVHDGRGMIVDVSVLF
jgi:hypothetical protein